MKRLLFTCMSLSLGSIVFAQTETKVQREKNQEPNAESLVVCPGLLQAEPMTRLGFAKATLVSLWFARNAAVDGSDMKDANAADNILSLQSALMRSAKTSTNDFLCARKSVRPFTVKQIDPEGNVRTAAQFLLAVYDSHIQINQRLIELIKTLPDIKVAEFSDRVSTLQVERGQRWADLVTPTTLALASMIDLKRIDEQGHVPYLIITKDQRKELLEWANNHFPEFTDGTPKDKWTDPAKTAEVYFSFLNERRCSDE